GDQPENRQGPRSHDPAVPSATSGPHHRVMVRPGARATWLMVMCAVCLVSTLSGAEAQQVGKVPRVGFLWTSSPELTAHALEAFRQGLREAGYIEGKTIVIEHRWAADVVQRLPDLAGALVGTKVDVIVTQG